MTRSESKPQDLGSALTKEIQERRAEAPKKSGGALFDQEEEKDLFEAADEVFVIFLFLFSFFWKCVDPIINLGRCQND